jgi:cysteinyl-tRNA synthetase
MAIRLYSTLSRKVEELSPLDPANVRMYVCGPTVYDYAHIGNARPVVVFDVLFRLLRQTYGESHVTYARNITDVDDKIIAAAKTTGESIGSVTERTTKAYHDDMAALGALSPTVEPRATQHIAEMIALTEKLIAKGNAYTDQGHVLFNVPSMADYGRLSRRNRDELIAGARVEVAPYKKDAADFVLWKPSSEDQPGWDSPWGRGRPGWHLECSAMSEKHLGVTFDIHGGGIDLVFPHHENEIAQSTCAHGPDTFAKIWMHNGHLMVEGEKMSKSLGNFYTVNDLLKEFPGEAIRLLLLKTHYRQPLDFTKAGLAEAKRELDGFYGVLRRAERLAPSPKTISSVISALSDDLNTPQAIAALHEMAGDFNRTGDGAEMLKASGAVLGLLQSDPEAWFKWQPEGSGGGLSDADIETAIQNRLAARKAKNFAEADRIRKELAEANVILEDGPGGTTWRRG